MLASGSAMQHRYYSSIPIKFHKYLQLQLLFVPLTTFYIFVLHFFITLFLPTFALVYLYVCNFILIM